MNVTDFISIICFIGIMFYFVFGFLLCFYEHLSDEHFSHAPLRWLVRLTSPGYWIMGIIVIVCMFLVQCGKLLVEMKLW